MKTKPTHLFHYTSELRLRQILSSEELKVSKARIDRGEKPALWFSLDPLWDESAYKHFNFDDKEEQAREIGLARIVLPFFDNFITYGKWKHVSRVSPAQMMWMESNFPHYKRGSWYASFVNIPKDEFICCEVWNGEAWILYDEKNIRNFGKYEFMFKPV